MELTLRTLQGNAVMRDLMPTTSVQQLKQMIYDACAAGQISLEVPTPDKQRLVGARNFCTSALRAAPAVACILGTNSSFCKVLCFRPAPAFSDKLHQMRMMCDLCRCTWTRCLTVVTWQVLASHQTTHWCCWQCQTCHLRHLWTTRR